MITPPRSPSASWVPAGVFIIAVCGLVIQGLVSGSNGVVVGVSALAGPLALLLLQVRLEGSASQSPLLLGGLLGGSAVLGGIWAGVASQLDDFPVLAAVAVSLLPLVLALVTVFVLSLRGSVEEPVDVLAYCTAISFGWSGGFVVILFGISIRAGMLDHAQSAALAMLLTSETLLRPATTSAGACLLVLLLPALHRPFLPAGWPLSRWAALLVTVLTLATAMVAPMYLGLADSLAALGGCALILGVLCGKTLARASALNSDSTGGPPVWLLRPDLRNPVEPDVSAPAAVEPEQSRGTTGAKPPQGTDGRDDAGGADTSVGHTANRTVELGGVVPPEQWSPPRVKARNSQPPSPLGMVGAVLALMAGLIVWGWWDGVRVGTQPCEPVCGPTPGPPTQDKDQSFDAAGWRVLHSAAMQPTVVSTHAVSWELSYPNYQGKNISVQIVFEDSAAPTSVDELLRQVTSREASGYREVYKIPNAGLGVYPGAGAALEYLGTKPGLMPTPTGFFIMGVAMGDRAVVGWARGPREADSRYNIHHYDPAFSLAAVGLANLASGFELLDASGQPIYRADPA